MPPAPPPPPANLPNFSANASNSKPSGLPNTSALLKSIEKGAKLKKTVTNDRSAPLVSSQQNSAAPIKISQNSATGSSNTNSTGLGGLFANGFPTLKSTKQTSNKTVQLPLKLTSESVPKVLKKPVTNFTSNLSEAISRDPEKALNVVKKGSQTAAPAIISKVTDHLDQNNISGKKDNPLIAAGSKINLPSVKSMSSGRGKSERWRFATENEEDLPNPRKYSGCKKYYIPKNNSSDKFSKVTVGAEVTENDIKGFIKTLKSKLDKAASEEDFEECVRLKSKLKSFEAIEKRIQSGEHIAASELPK